MSENLISSKIIKDKPRSKKLHPRVDLSAMISISFLLIIFFMVSAEMSKPQVMNLGLSERPEEVTCRISGCIDGRRLVTLLLDKDDNIISYRGLIKYTDENPKKWNYGKDGIRKELIKMKKQILEATGDINKGAIVIIKPSEKSSYGNLIDILDEMAITNINTYAIVNDYTPEESTLLASR